MAAAVKFQSFAYNQAKGKINLQSDSIKFYLSNTAPNVATMAVKADLAEISAGNGYTAGGFSCPNTTYSEASGTAKIVGDMYELTASGGSVGPFRYVVAYDDTTASPADPLMAYWDYGSAITLAAGEKFRFRPSSVDTGGDIVTVA